MIWSTIRSFLLFTSKERARAVRLDIRAERSRWSALIASVVDRGSTPRSRRAVDIHVHLPVTLSQVVLPFLVGLRTLPVADVQQGAGGVAAKSELGSETGGELLR